MYIMWSSSTWYAREKKGISVTYILTKITKFKETLKMVNALFNIQCTLT